MNLIKPYTENFIRIGARTKDEYMKTKTLEFMRTSKQITFPAMYYKTKKRLQALSREFLQKTEIQ